MKNMTLENIAAACGGQIYYMREDLAQKTAKGVVIDSRQIEPGYIDVYKRQGYTNAGDCEEACCAKRTGS